MTALYIALGSSVNRTIGTCSSSIWVSPYKETPRLPPPIMALCIWFRSSNAPSAKEAGSLLGHAADFRHQPVSVGQPGYSPAAFAREG